MTEKFIPREGEPMKKEDLYPAKGTRQEKVYRSIRNVLARYVVRGDSKQIDQVALEIWRETRK